LRLFHQLSRYLSKKIPTIVHLAIVPQKIELPKIAMQILAANAVIDADQQLTSGLSGSGPFDLVRQ
jgi:hypothetical protein